MRITSFNLRFFLFFKVNFFFLLFDLVGAGLTPFRIANHVTQPPKKGRQIPPSPTVGLHLKIGILNNARRYRLYLYVKTDPPFFGHGSLTLMGYYQIRNTTSTERKSLNLPWWYLYHNILAFLGRWAARNFNPLLVYHYIIEYLCTEPIKIGISHWLFFSRMLAIISHNT